jgi:hypothetical protein
MGSLRAVGLSVTIIVAGLVGNQAWATNLVINGSFETGNISGWTISSGTCVWQALTAGQTTSQAGAFVAPTPPNGNFVLLSDAGNPGPCTFQQDVALPPGTSDILTLAAGYNYRNFDDPTGAGCSTTVAATTTGGAPLATAYSASGGANQAIAPQGSVNLSAHAGTTVRIIVTTVSCIGGPAGVVLDNVVLDSNPLASAIPTLSEWTLIVLGLLLAAIGVVVIRRRHTA